MAITIYDHHIDLMFNTIADNKSSNSGNTMTDWRVDWPGLVADARCNGQLVLFEVLSVQARGKIRECLYIIKVSMK